MLLFAVLLAVPVVAACGGGDSKPAGKTPVAPEATQTALQTLTIDIDSQSRITMSAPVGAAATVAGKGYRVRAGDGFQIDLTGGPPSIEVTKRDVQANTNAFKGFIVEDPAGLLWTNQVDGKLQYHFYVVVSALRGFACEDTKGPAFTEAQARLMFQACRSVAPAAVPK